ncbi:spexin prohormone 2 isoform X2 [Dicentrarchus labrax]|uniref:spexin prohormone 2 isoform X2 n=1 Tax=Dicentrarchus labrax TaxID=13489 RepID=UPI0021F679DB|nr:spexin prohormone 2 isoform X2 [Dicentrarchus labrax]
MYQNERCIIEKKAEMSVNQSDYENNPTSALLQPEQTALATAGDYHAGGMNNPMKELNTPQRKQEYTDTNDHSSKDCGSVKDSDVHPGPAGVPPVWAAPPSDISLPGVVPHSHQHTIQPGMLDPLSLRFHCPCQSTQCQLTYPDYLLEPQLSQYHLLTGPPDSSHCSSVSGSWFTNEPVLCSMMPVVCNVSGGGQVVLVNPCDPGPVLLTLKSAPLHRDEAPTQGKVEDKVYKGVSVLDTPSQLPEYPQAAFPLYESRDQTANMQPQVPAAQTVCESRSRKPCHCTRSQCLKLYCECFANGVMCSNCDCSNCHNNAEHEMKRHKAIKSHDASLETEGSKWTQDIESASLRANSNFSVTLDAKALKRQLKQWRQNSAKYYRKQKTLRDVLDLTPPSITDETDVEPGPSRKVLRPMTENGENQCALEAPSPVVTLRTSTPKPNRSAASRLRAKLIEKSKSLQTKHREIDRLRKQVKRMKMRKEETKTRNKLTKDVRSSVKRRQLMGSAIRTFFHRNDVSTIVNGKAQIRRSGQVFQRRFLCDTVENLHKRFLMEDPSKKISHAQFFKCRPQSVVLPRGH